MKARSRRVPVRRVAVLLLVAGITAVTPSKAAFGAPSDSARHPGITATTTPNARASARPRIPQALQPNDNLARPSWWSGPCDVGDNSISVRLKANFDGLQACGPSGETYLVNFFPGAWGEYEWQCVELSMRWMYMAWGVKPYGANGNGVVANYPNGQAGYPALRVVKNGTVDASPQPGDVLSIDNTDQYGHTEVVASSSVDGNGNGTLTAITENWGSGSNGWVTLTVSDWVVSDGVPGNTVLAWLHNPAWNLELPVQWELTSQGALQIEDTGSFLGGFSTVATGIAEAQVIGGDGWEPEPIVVALTTGGELEDGYYLPGLPGRSLAPVASGVKSFAVSDGPGTRGRPILGWVTKAGSFDVLDGTLLGKPELEASGVSEISIAPNSGPGGPLVGYLSTAGGFFVKDGTNALSPKSPWSEVATSVTSIALAGGDQAQVEALEGYVSDGDFYVRQGLTGSFALQASDVGSMALASVGTKATPLLAYVSGSGSAAPGDLEVGVGLGGGAGFSVQATGISSVSLASSMSSAAFPIVGAVTSQATFEVEESALNKAWTTEAKGVSAAGVAALTVT